MKSEKEIAKEELIAQIKDVQKEMVRALSSPGGTILTNTPFIIKVGKVYVDPILTLDRKEVVSGPTPTGLPHLVKRFSRVDAEMVAKNVKNGEGIMGTIVSWAAATADQLREYSQLLQKIESC